MSADKDCETAMEAGISASQIDGEFYRRLVDDSPVGLALVAIDGRWLNVNRALSELFGYSEHELSQLTFQQLTHAEHLEADLQHVQEFLSRSEEHTSELQPLMRISYDVFCLKKQQKSNHKI